MSFIEPQISTWRLVSLYLSICFGLFLALLDTSIIATALYTIGVELHALSKVNWIALAYTLAYLGSTAIFASLSDVFGRRNVYIAASVTFLTFSFACGWARSLNQLIAFRALQGVGGSGLYSIGFVILPEITPLRMMKMIGALAGIVMASSGILGPVLGGLITANTTWRWIFWINAPIGAVQIILFILAWPGEQQLKPAERRSLRQVDIVGFFLLIAASIPFVLAFQEAGIQIVEKKRIWSTAIFVAPLVVGIICWIALIGWEYLISTYQADSINAFFPMRLFTRRIYMSAVIATMLTGFAYFVLIYSLPVHFQVVYGHSALSSGIALLPMLGSAAIGSTFAGAISGRKNVTFWIMVAGAMFMLIATASLTTLDNVAHAQTKAYGLQVFAGLGFGLTISTSSMLAMLESEVKDYAIAQGIVAQARVLGGSIGIAVCTVILSIKLRQQLLETGLLDASQLQSLRDVMPQLNPHQIQGVRQAYTDTLHEALVVCAIISGVCVLVSLGCWQKNPLSMQDYRERRNMEQLAPQKAIAEKRVDEKCVDDSEKCFGVDT